MNRSTSRREALTLIGGAGVALTVGCGGTSITSAGGAPTPIPTTGDCAVSPTETLGPYPSLMDLVRSDIREDRDGTPLTLVIVVVNVNASCSAVVGAAVDVWQCDALGRYSEYAQPGYDGRGSTFLRGVQTTDAAGLATFVTVYPGWYAGRATHIHAQAKVGGRSSKVTQIAFPEDVTADVYASGVYASKGPNPTTNSRDGIFSDSLALQFATLTGGLAGGYTATFRLGVAV